MKLPNPFLNKHGRLRNGWWIALFFVVLALLLVPQIVLARDGGAGVPIWRQAVTVLVASLVCQALRRRPLAELFGAFTWRWPRELALGLGLGAALMLAPALILLALGAVRFSVGAGFAALLPGALLFAAVAVTEELTFRGFLFQRLIDGLGAWPAQLIIAALFVLTHSAALQDAGLLGDLAGANIFLASIMFGLAFARTKSLALPLGLHFAADFVQGSVLGFGVSGNEEAGMLRPQLNGADWLSGGAFGLEASAPGILCVIAATALLLVWKPAARQVAPRN